MNCSLRDAKEHKGCILTCFEVFNWQHWNGKIPNFELLHLVIAK